jgi:hypothetical protein
MTVTVGTDVYLSVADADTYWSNKNDTVWSAATTADKEKALREATQYIDGAFEFIGSQVATNVLAFPRYDVYIRSGNFAGISYDSTTIPPQIEDATAELALEALSSRLLPSQARGGAIKKEKVDVIEVEYLDFAPSQTSYSFVALLLKPLLIGGKNTKELVRT